MIEALKSYTKTSPANVCMNCCNPIFYLALLIRCCCITFLSESGVGEVERWKG